MAVEGTGKIIKILMFVVNFVILIGGITVLAVGVWIVVDKSYVEQILGTTLYASAAYILIVTGIIVAVFAFFGCFGAIREVKGLLLIYFVLLFLTFLLLMVAGILGFAFRGQLEELLKDKMKSTIVNEYGIDMNNAEVVLVTDAWDATQRQLSCCGVGRDTVPNDFSIWLTSNWCTKNYDNAKPRPSGAICVPWSCCGKLDTDSPCSVDNINAHTKGQGCLDAGYDLLQSNAMVVGGVGLGIACTLIFGMLFSLCLYRQID